MHVYWDVAVDNYFQPRVIQERGREGGRKGLMGYKPRIYFIKSEDIGKSFRSLVIFEHNDSFDSGKSQVSVFGKYIYP